MEEVKSLRKIRKKRQKLKSFLPQSTVVRRAAIVAGIAGIICAAIFTVLALKQKSFEQDVYAMQKSGVKQVQQFKRANDTGAEPIAADYSAADVKTLTPNDLKKVNEIQQIRQYGVGLLEIPAISLKLPILEGLTQANLSVGAGTAKPDQQLGKGNFVLLGHYMTNKGILFGGLRYVQKGNDILVTYHDHQVVYEVIDSKVIHRSEVQYMEDQEENEKLLTLITCDSSREGTPNRLVVRAELKE